MEECNICLSKIKKQNKNKHEKSKKHKYFFSNLIINKYIIKKTKLINLKISFNHSIMSIKRNTDKCISIRILVFRYSQYELCI